MLSQTLLNKLTSSFALDSNLLTGAVFMDLSKAFDSITHDSLIAKFHAHGFSFETLTFLNSYLRNRKCIKINNICRHFLKILSAVPQGSILGSILFNMNFTKPRSRINQKLFIQRWTTIWHIYINFSKGITQACSFKDEKLERNQAGFMTKELRKAIIDRSRLKNKYLK